MLPRIKNIGSRKVSIKTAVLVIALVLFAVTAIAARYESLTVGDLYVDDVAALSSNHTLDVTSPRVDGTYIDRTDPTIPDLSGTSYYNVTAPGTYWVDTTQTDGVDATRDSGTGVSLIINQSALTSANDGAVFEFKKVPGASLLSSGGGSGSSMFSGTTPVCISLEVASSATPQIWNQTTGVTYAVSNSGLIEPCEVCELDAAGDSLAFKFIWGGSVGGSTLFQTERMIQ
jgi:hypothetical protein